MILTSIESNVSVASRNEIVDFTVAYASLGEPSCALATLSTNNKNFASFSFGSDPLTCSSAFPNIPYQGAYQKNLTHFKFSSLMISEGRIKLNLTAQNKISTSIPLISYVIVSSIECQPPELSIESRAADFFSPAVYKRSQLVDILVSVKLDCSSALSNTKKWSVYKASAKNGQILSELSLSNNPTVFNSEIVVEPNFLSYGLYKFVFSVAMAGPGKSLDAFKSEIEHFVLIRPTGIVVSALYGGVNQVSIGTNQTLKLDPVQYSFDYDSAVAMRSLRFRFYCQVLDKGVGVGYPSRSLNEKLDLLEFKKGGYNMSTNTTCFSSPGNYFFKYRFEILLKFRNFIFLR